MRTVIYARYSSDNQREASIEDQIRVCRDRIENEGWSLVEVYSDAAVSGATTLRPGYQKMLEAARNGGFDVVVAEALDRLSRDQEDVAGLYKQLTFSCVQLVTIAEGEITDLHIGLKGTMNALYLKDLADKTRRGLRGRVEAGRSGGGNSYGYDVVPGTEEDRGRRSINRTESRIVIRIFEEYRTGKSPRRIAFDLNTDRVPGPAGKDWGPSTINGNRARGTGVLNNELYIGRLVWNRLRYIKNPDTGKRVSKLNPEDEWIVKDVLGADPELGNLGFRDVQVDHLRLDPPEVDARDARNPIGVEVEGDPAWRLAGAVLLANPNNDLRFGSIYGSPAAILLGSRNHVIAIAVAATRSTRFHSAPQATAGLICEVLEEQRVHGALETDMEVTDLAFR